MDSILSMFPNSGSVVVTPIAGIAGKLSDYALSDYIHIIPSSELVNQWYLPLVAGSHAPEYYIVGVAEDERYKNYPLLINNDNDASASISLAQLALSIYCKSPFYFGTSICFSKYIHSPVILSQPSMPGINWELDDNLFRGPYSPFWCTETDISHFNHNLHDFFYSVASSYYRKVDERWNLAAFSFLSAVNRRLAYEAILDFSTSLEALLNTDKESIGFKVRLYTALLVGETYQKRMEILNDIKKFYNLRSQIIHGKYSKIGKTEMLLISRVGSYIGELLKNTCGKNIEKDVFNQLDYMSLHGAPLLSTSNNLIIITEEDIIEGVKLFYEDSNILNCSFSIKFGSDDEMAELYVNVIDENGNTDSRSIYTFINFIPKLKGINNINFWVTQDTNGKYKIQVKYK